MISIGINALIPEHTRSTTIADAAPTIVHFGDVMAAAEAFIRGSEQLVGAVAWVRSPRLIEALAERPVALIVNKEFALRKKGTKERDALAKLRKKAKGYDATARVAGDCSRGAFTGLMHHKFLVRLTRGVPTVVWTGSFNFTSGAAGNFENAVEIHDPAVALAFLDEFRLLWTISEPLDFRQGRPRGMPAEPVRRAPAATRSVLKHAGKLTRVATKKPIMNTPAKTAARKAKKAA